MLKKADDLYKLLNIKKEKDDFDNDIIGVINVIKNKTGLVIDKKNIFRKKNIFNLKTSSNIRFLILLNLDKINKDINLIQPGCVIEL